MGQRDTDTEFERLTADLERPAPVSDVDRSANLEVPWLWHARHLDCGYLPVGTELTARALLLSPDGAGWSWTRIATSCGGDDDRLRRDVLVMGDACSDKLMLEVMDTHTFLVARCSDRHSQWALFPVTFLERTPEGTIPIWCRSDELLRAEEVAAIASCWLRRGTLLPGYELRHAYDLPEL